MKYNYFIKKAAALCVLTLASYMATSQSKIELYGMTEYGGASNYGTIYKTDTAGHITLLASFKGTNGANPYGGLIEASDGNFYGMTSSGGDSNEGVIFKCDTLGNITRLVTLGVVTGMGPQGNLLQASDGNLYGLTSAGGKGGYGTLFKCTLSGTLTVLDNFGYAAVNGQSPLGTLIQAADGYLYGMASGGGDGSAGGYYGTIFKSTLAGSLTDVYEFAGYNGQYPNAGGLLQASDGYIYAIVTGGGAYNYGLINKYVSGPLVSFTGLNGGNPGGGIIQATDGKFYGLTNTDGGNGEGTLFSCTTTGGITDLFDFTFATTGSVGGLAKNTLLQASDGYIYGTATAGGAGSAGTLFKYNIGGSVRILASFNTSTTGAAPYGNLVQWKKVIAGIPSISNTNQINLYPNPDNGKFTLQISNSLLTVKNQLEIYNALGEKVYQSVLNTNTTQINISNQPAGIYYYRALSKDGALIGTGKFIIQ